MAGLLRSGVLHAMQYESFLSQDGDRWRTSRDLVVCFSGTAICRQRCKLAVRIVLQQVSTDDSEAALREQSSNQELKDGMARPKLACSGKHAT